MSQLVCENEKCGKSVKEYADFWEFEGKLLCYECYQNEMQYTNNPNY